jgi:hypothetical protein
MKSTEVMRVTASQDAVIRSQTKKPEMQEKEHHEKGVITFSWMKTGDTSNVVSSRSEAEKAVAESLCLPLIVNEVDVGMDDEGASRSVMSRSACDRVKRRMSKQSQLIRTLNYVADDKNDNDIVGDLEQGRASIGTSRYSCVDTRGTRWLLSLDLNGIDRIPCRRQHVNDSTGHRQLMMLDDDTRAKSMPAKTCMSKIRLLSSLVQSCEAKNYLYDRLMKTIDQCDIDPDRTDDIDDEEVVDDDSDDDDIITETDEVNLSSADDDGVIDTEDGDDDALTSIHICYSMGELNKTDRRSKDEQVIASESMASFIPVAMKKVTHSVHDQVETEQSSQHSLDDAGRDDEVMDDTFSFASPTDRAETGRSSQHSLDSAGRDDEVMNDTFPFASPTRRKDSLEYLAVNSTKMVELVDANENLTSSQKKMLSRVLVQYTDRLSITDENMERTDSVEHEIDTGSRRPFRERLRQYAPTVQKIIIVGDEVQSMLKGGVIIPSKSPYASNLRLVRKPDPTAEGGVKKRVCASFVQLKHLPDTDDHASDLLSRDAVVTEPVRLNAQRTSCREKPTVNYEVVKVLDSRVDEKSKTGERKYMVKWKGYIELYNTWEPARYLATAADAIADYESQQRQLQPVDDDTELRMGPVTGFTCDLCQEECVNESAWLVHRCHTHDQQVPVDCLAKMNITTDVDVLHQLQQTDAELRVVFTTKLGTEGLESLTPHERNTMLNNEFVLSDSGLLYVIENSQVRSQSRMHTQLRLCVPRTERRRVLYHCHDTYAHPGIVHLCDQLRERMWWLRMLTSVNDDVRGCKECQVNTGNRMKYLPRPMSVPEGPWTHVAIDRIGPFPMINGGNIYILVVVDRFTRYAEAFACTDESAVTTANLIMDKVICRRLKKLVIRWRRPYVILRISSGDASGTLMNNDTETAVDVDRVRPHDDDIMSIEDQRKRDVELVAQDHEVVNDSIRDLTVRKKELLNERQIAAASRDIEHQASTDANEVVVRQLYTASNTKHDHLYDYDDEESWDGVCVTSYDSVLLW